jgi:type I restriction-modification system DNA methylase subunit
MEKKQAIQLISDTFNAKFDEDRFSLFIKNLLNDIEPKSNRYSGQMLWDDYKDHINSYKRIGKYIDPEGEPLDVLIVEVKTIAKLERARTSLRNFVIKHLKKFDKDFALVAFYAEEDNGIDWRFSFIKLEHQSYFDEEKDKVKIKEDLTPAKRYSFLVGEYEQSHTAKTQLLPLLQNLANNPTVEDLENAFSIEKVTDEFFEQYKDLFNKLSNHFTNDAHIKAELYKANIDNARFTKKLLGQIVFLYFLQKKGWLGVPKNEKWGKGQKRFIQNLYDTSQQEGNNFFKDKLQHLFYEALAKERENDNSFYEKFDCRIPFLNGGLFEAEYNWETANISIPENIFRNQEKNKAGDTGTGVLDVFDRYNFTIKEDEPLDKEVAVDPEMLGKVFENMLEITERKSKGAFYTPREIVHYMCQESLIHYLDNALDGKVKKQDIETYIRKGHNALENDQRVAKKGEETATYKYILPKSIRKNADLIDQKLIDIKICDPAIGSGAFPVGLLHELVNAQLVIKPHFTDNYLNAKLKEFQFTKKETPSESRYIYRLKRHIIQESIYGVDIDASAIDIARLRLWLSLVVDEDDFDPIETLPNLDYKIVCGNSLISRYELDKPIDKVFEDYNKKLQDKDYNNEAIKTYLKKENIDKIDLSLYKKLTNDFLLESDHDKKELFRELISEIKNAFKTTLEIGDIKNLRDARGAVENLQNFDIFGKQVGTKTQISKAKKQLVKLEKQKQETQDGVLFKNAVEWRFEFPNLLDEYGDFVGFDVVIGNPPYVYTRDVDFGKGFKDVIAKNYFSKLSSGEKSKATQSAKINLFALFIMQGLFVNKKNGTTSFIVPNNILRTTTYDKIRRFILDNYSLSYIMDLGAGVFKNVTASTVILAIEKQQDNENECEVITDIESIENFEYNQKQLKQKAFLKNVSYAYNIHIDFESQAVLDKVNINSNYFGEYCIDIIEGIVAHKALISTESSQNTFPLIEGKTIKRYYLQKIRKHIEWDVPQIHRKRPDYLWEEEKKIVMQRISGGLMPLVATIDKNKNRAFASVNNIILKEEFSHLYNLFTALLNSELLNWFYSISFSNRSNLTVNISKTFTEKLPINGILKYKEITIIVDYLLNYKSDNTKSEALVLFFEQIINSIVYELYFEQELIQANKQVLKHLTDLKSIDDTMSEEEKLATIQAEFERLYHPEHPVRFAVETLDSIEEVRIIKEALR